jgi:DegV family protein with EDD domain
MHIVTDHGADLAPGQLEGLDIHYVPLRITLEGKTYVGGEDITSEEFYGLLSKTDAFPTTSQPSAGEFATLYRKLAETDPEILSIHISSGLSGTVQSAIAGADMVPEAKVTIVDTLTLSCPEGWLVESAVKARQAGWSVEKIVDLLMNLRGQVEGVFSLSSLKYLVHGGRISHLKGLVASLLNIKPIIAVDHATGKYETHGQEVTLKRALNKIVSFAQSIHPEGTPLRIQPLHGYNPEAVEILVELFKEKFPCRFEPVTPVAPVLGAHTGPSLVGAGFAAEKVFDFLSD